MPKIHCVSLYTARVWYGVPDHGTRHFPADAGSLCDKADVTSDTINADSHIACRAHAVPLPCQAAKGLECVFTI